MTPRQLRLALFKLELSQAKLARLVGASPRTLRHWLTGDRAAPLTAALLIHCLLTGRLTIDELTAAQAELTRKAKRK